MGYEKGWLRGLQPLCVCVCVCVCVSSETMLLAQIEMPFRGCPRAPARLSRRAGSTQTLLRAQ
jgi:hypothetical protein